MFTSKKFNIFTGSSSGIKEMLSGFDYALIDAGVSCYNLALVSSILPPLFKHSDVIDVSSGEVLFAAYSSITKKGTGIISSAVGIGIPEDESSIGVIMKYSCTNNKAISESKVREMTISAMKAREISVKEVLVTSSEVELSEDTYSTVLAGVALW